MLCLHEKYKGGDGISDVRLSYNQLKVWNLRERKKRQLQISMRIVCLVQKQR